MTIAGLTEEQFRPILRRYLTPGRAISSTEYLRGRETKLRQIDRAFNSDGKHIFIYGDRGVGKTSLGRTAAFIHGSTDGDPTIIECEQKNTAYQLLRDIALCCVPPERLLSSTSSKKTLKGGLPYLSGELMEEVTRGQIPEMKTINEALAITLTEDGVMAAMALSLLLTPVG
jgi:Cdc6-like AAA superfamily ATPase